MNKNKIIFWATTGIVVALMLFSGSAYFLSPDMKAALGHLGFPDYFRVELGVLKILGAIALLLPMVPAKIKEFAYFGFGLVFVSAVYSHLSIGDDISEAIAPLVFLAILTVSYMYKDKIDVA